ncbi:MAG: DUF1883 domain-containing protein [Planctomycetaceae bacterium]|nr:DUF1883 domain-containing protein [Planctomycetaceae bacterium]
MNFLHFELDLGCDDAVEVTLNHQANVRLLDDANFERYRNGQHHKYYGGLATESPVVIPAPRSGHWHVVVDLGGYAGKVSASVGVLKAVR